MYVYTMEGVQIKDVVFIYDENCAEIITSSWLWLIACESMPIGSQCYSLIVYVYRTHIHASVYT